MGLSNHEITLKSVLTRIKNPQKILASVQELLSNPYVFNHYEIEILDARVVIVTERLACRGESGNPNTNPRIGLHP